jgi:DNA repair exonuclease SbcCD ATPase subunit
MKISELTFKNILSYGNMTQTIKFDDKPKLILVEGSNGAGKSSIKEAMTVAIYGRSAIRKMKDIPNWINRNAQTGIKFTTTNGDAIEITRGVDPNFSDVKINGVTHNLPDKRKVDDFIEEELAQIPFPVFCNTISLSFDDFKSFVSLTQADKRKIVDRIFGIDILTDMRTVVKETLRDTKKEIDILSSSITKSSEKLENTAAQLSNIKDAITKKIDDDRIALTSLIEEKTAQFDTVKTERDTLTSTIKGLNETIKSNTEKVSQIKSDIRQLKQRIDIYEKNRCPHCLNDLTLDTAVKTKEAIDTKYQKLVASLDPYSALLEKDESQVTDLLITKGDLDTTYYELQADIQSLQKDLKKIDVAPVVDQTAAFEELVNSLKLEIREDTSAQQVHLDKNSLYLNLDDLLSDSGIKKSMIDKIIPALNTRITEISERLEFKFQFSFDSDFNPTISYLGMDVSQESLSSGQRKKMNLIVLLAFIEIIKMKHSTMNVMFLDEIFASLDKGNVYKSIEILREYADTYGMTIFVVSHESLPEEFFDAKILVTTKDHFSEMQIVNNSKTLTPEGV